MDYRMIPINYYFVPSFYLKLNTKNLNLKCISKNTTNCL